VERDCRFPMMNPPLKDEKEKTWSDEDQSLLSEHLKARKPGTDNPLQEPLKFHTVRRAWSRSILPIKASLLKR